MEISDIPQGAQGKYNQAFFLQLRLHELWLRIDRMSTNLLDFSPMFKLYNYEVVFNDLGSILRMVRPYLLKDAKEKIMKEQKELRELINTNKVWGTQKSNSKVYTTYNAAAWKSIQIKLYDFELNIEELAHKHGLGNPTKADPSRAIID